MKTIPVLLALLGSLVLCGCSSTQHYELTLNRPNPFSTHIMRSETKPQKKSENFVRFRDEHDQQFQIEAKYVQSVKPPPPNPEGNPADSIGKYQIILTEDNPYRVKVAYTPEKPNRVSQKYYLIKRMDGREAKIPEVYVSQIESKTKKDLYDEPDDQFTDRFEFR